jgi:hypothetical protein
MTLLVQGPDTVYVYWDLSEHQWAIINRHGRAMLKLYRYAGADVDTAQRSLSQEVFIPPFGSSWYFYKVRPDEGYFCEIGYMHEDGEFLPVLRSNNVHTPALPVTKFTPARKHNSKTRPNVFQVEFSTNKAVINRKSFELPLQDVLLEMLFYKGIFV